MCMHTEECKMISCGGSTICISHTAVIIARHVLQAELQACPGTKGTCECFKLDLEDLSSVKAFALEQSARLKKAGKSLHVLINNAGEVNKRVVVW